MTVRRTLGGRGKAMVLGVDGNGIGAKECEEVDDFVVLLVLVEHHEDAVEGGDGKRRKSALLARILTR